VERGQPSVSAVWRIAGWIEAGDAEIHSLAAGIIIIHAPPLANPHEHPICGAPACRRRPLNKDEKTHAYLEAPRRSGAKSDP
jgi:hypothetical protein